MKKLILIALFTASAVASYAQGTVNFQNKVAATVGPPPTPAIDAPVSYAAGTPLGGSTGARIDGSTHATAWIGLYGGAAGTPEDQLVLLAPALHFRSGNAAGYVDTLGNASRALVGVAPGAQAVVQVRAWDTANGTLAADYATASSIQGAYLGKSAMITLTAGGAGSPPGPAANMYGLNAFAINVPEPGTIALGFLGLGGLFLLRRKK